MRHFLIAILFIPSLVFSQTYNYEELYLPITEGKIKYTEVVQAPGKTKAELFQSAKVWFADNFRSAKDVINFQDESAGIVSGRGNTSIYMKLMGQVIERTLYFSIKIEARDERYRYTIEEIEISGMGLEKRPIETEFSREYMFNNKGKPRQISWDWYAQYEPEIIGLETKLKTQIAKKAEDW